jgi:fibronectin type 3 domain-containing protein
LHLRAPKNVYTVRFVIALSDRVVAKMRTRAIGLAMVMLLSLGSPALAVASGAFGPMAAGPMSEFPVWSDSFDDMGHVYVPTGGLVGVAVAGGDVHLLTGSQTGWVASSVITCPAGFRYDLVLLEAYLPGKSHVNVTILDASKAPTVPGFANATVPPYVNITATDVSLFNLSQVAYPAIRIQVDLFASGADRPRLLAWNLMFIDLGRWQDEFLGMGKMSAHQGINVTSGLVEINMSATGGPSYDPYPTIIFPDPAGDIDAFYATAAGDGYSDLTTIVNSGEATGLEVADLDGDGYLDLIAVGAGSSSGTPIAMIFWGGSSGKWSVSDQTTLTIGNSGTDAAVGDFNGDGQPDIAVSCVGGMMGDSYCFLNKGNGVFNTNPDITFQGVQATNVDAGDVNNDGYDDVVFVQALLTLGSCYYGGSSGPDANVDLRFLGEITTHGYVGDVLVKDVDGDGYLDVLFATLNDDGEAPIYLGGASGVDVTADITLLLDWDAFGVAAGDIDGDGLLDLIYTTQDMNAGKSYLEMFEGTSSGWDKDHKHTITCGSGLNPVQAIDVDRDGFDDIVTGDDDSMDIYLGGSTWPTAASITKTGLDYPEDLAVAVPSGGGGGGHAGHFVTEPILVPEGMRWDILYLESYVPAGASATVSVLDAKRETLPGLGKLAARDLDLGAIGDQPLIHVRVDLKAAPDGSGPSLARLLVNWVDKMAWREQFYGEAKFASALGLDAVDYKLYGPMDPSDRPDLLFASLRGDFAYDTQSVAFLAEDGPAYTSVSSLQFKTTGASAVDAYDVDGDGILDLAFASYGPADGSYAGTSPLFLGSPDGWYQQPYHSFPTTGAMGVTVRDLNGDGHADFVFAQERDWTGPMVNSTLFWGSASGWNATPDVGFETAGASDVEALDLNGDGMLDLVFACYEDDSGMSTDSMVFLQTAAGFAGGVPSYLLPTLGARAVAFGDLNKDGRMDLVFANSYDGVTSSVDSSIYWGKVGGGFEVAPKLLPTLGAVDIKVADLDGDRNFDLVFANGRNATGGITGDSYIYLNHGSGQFGPAPDVRLPTTGASAVAVTDLDGVGRKDIVFATLTNETGYGAPSVVYLGSVSKWPSSPSFEVPTVGAMDVLPILLSDPARGGYLSQVITPDAADDIGAYHTLSYSATLADGLSGSIRVIDAATGETLFQSPLATGGGSLDLSSAISYREHPSVRVRVYADGMSTPYGFVLDDLWLNWTKRVKAAPVIVDMGLTNTTCYRGKSVELSVNVTDEFTVPGALDVRVEHRLEGETAWRSYLLGAPTFRDGLWRCVVAPDRLVPVGVYTFHVNVTDSDGLFTGERELAHNLTVLPNLPRAPHTATATAGDREVVVGWLPPTDWGDVPVEAYQVWRGLTADALGLATTVTAPAVTYRDTDVTNGVTYHYAIKALNYLGVGPMSEIINATPGSPPSEPRGLNAAIGSGRVTLTWEAPLSDGGKPVTGYRVYRGANGGALTMVAEVAGLTYGDTGLSNGVVYSYRVSALTETGEGPQCEPVSAMPLALPSEVRDLAVTVGVRNLTLAWLSPLDTGGVAVLRYVIYRGDAADGLSKLTELPGDAAVFKDEGIVVGRTYYYAVVAVTIAGEGPRGLVASGMAIDRPGQPQGLVATAGNGNVTLNWTAPGSDGASPITGYIVLRGSSPLSLAELAQLGVVMTFVDTAVTNGQTYYYAVVAQNGAGRGEPSPPVSVKPAKPIVAPGRVANLIFSVKDGKVTLQWTAPASDGGSPLIGYVVLRGTSPGNMTLLTELGTVTSHTDATAKRGTTYYYTVVAKNAVGQGEPFAAQEVKVPKAAKKSPGLEAPAALLALAATLILITSWRRHVRVA